VRKNLAKKIGWRESYYLYIVFSCYCLNHRYQAAKELGHVLTRSWLSIITTDWRTWECLRRKFDCSARNSKRLGSEVLQHQRTPLISSDSVQCKAKKNMTYIYPKQFERVTATFKWSYAIVLLCAFQLFDWI